MAEAAIGMVETKGYTGAIEATDGMAKAANVSISKSIPIGGGLITVICRGDVASVKAAVDAGSKAAAKVGELVDLGVAAGVVDKSGSWISYGDQRIGQGRENAKQFLRDNPDVAGAIEAKIRANAGLVASAMMDVPEPDADADSPE